MANVWDADIDITAEMAARLIARQFPVLSPVQIEPFGVGWDNVAYRVNGRYVFRLPRRKFAVRFLVNEARVLPRLAPFLPLPIPAPTFVGVPDPEYAYPFVGYVMIPGTTACRPDWSDAERAANAEPLARFLSALHRIPIDEATRAAGPGDEIHRADMGQRVPQLRERLAKIAPLLPEETDFDRLLPQVDLLAAALLHTGPPVWVHGDLYPRHLLVDDGRRLCGVIDWGDVHQGDPALDLSIAFTFLPPGEARETFRRAYGVIDDAAWDRARFRAIHYGAALVLYGVDVGDEAIRRVGEYALRFATERG